VKKGNEEANNHASLRLDKSLIVAQKMKGLRRNDDAMKN